MAVRNIKHANAKTIESYFERLVKLENWLQEPPQDAYLTTFFITRLQHPYLRLLTTIQKCTLVPLKEATILCEQNKLDFGGNRTISTL